MPTVTVALLGSLEKAFEEASLFDDASRRLAWDQRKQVQVEVSDDQTLGSILKEAGEKLGARGPQHPSSAPVPTFFASFEEGGEWEFTQPTSALTIVDSDGRARWHAPYEALTYQDLTRAVEAGVHGGDPRRLYYVTWPGVGNGVILGLTALVAGLRLAYDVMQVLANLDGSVSFTKRLIGAVTDRLGAGRKAIEANESAWTSRAADAPAIRHMLGDRTWQPSSVATLLGCTEDEARAVLWAFGFAEAEDGWRKGADPEAEVVDVVYEEVNLSHDLGQGDFEKTLRGRLGYYLNSGNRAPRPFVDGTTFGDETQSEAIRQMTPEELATVHGGDQLDADVPPELENDELNFNADEPFPKLPLPDLRLSCGCAKQDCEVQAAFGVANGKLKIGFTADTDHFVVDPAFMGEVAENVEWEIMKAKEPEQPG